MTQRSEWGGACADGAQHYRMLVDAITGYGVYMSDPDGTVVSWNRGAGEITGYRHSEIIGRNFAELFTAEDQRARLPKEALQTAVSEGRFETEGWQVRKDGSRVWTHAVVNPIRESGGELAGFAHVIRDLSQWHSSRMVLRQSEEQFRLLVQSVTDYAIYMLDPDGFVASWNAGAERIKGYRPDEVIGTHFSRFYSQEEREAGEPARGLRIAAEEGHFEKEGLRIRKDGSRFWASIVIAAIREEGKLIGFAKITRDISERVEAQRALDEAREALFQAQKMEALGQLTGGIAHDFNNLLMVVLSSLEILRKNIPANGKLNGLLDNAVKASERGSTLTQRMLAFARRQELEYKPVDLPQLIASMKELLQPSLGPSIQIETQLPHALPAIHGDANQLESALLNLVVNARDAMPEGGPIRISARAETVSAGHRLNLPPGRYVCLSVEDEGEGMDEETLRRATDPFFTTKGVGKGTGLGLSMALGVAEQLGGRLVLISERGKGTRAEFWLSVSARQEPADPEPVADRTEAETASLAVLVVDDDFLVAMNTAAMLEDLGHSVSQVISGEKALDILEETHIDLVITDQAMPRMTGVELAAAIQDRWPQIPIILATGYAELPEGPGRRLAKISKPFTQRQLADAVSAAMASQVEPLADLARSSG